MALICLIDAAFTIYLVGRGLAHEANPILAWSLKLGDTAFIATKLATFLPALTAIEALRPHIGDFGRLALRVGIVAYLVFYAIGIAAMR